VLCPRCRACAAASALPACFHCLLRTNHRAWPLAQVVASDIDKELGEYRAAMAQINADARSGSGGEGGIPDRARSIASSINALPELQVPPPPF
jgi:hypothetical protein